MRISDWSSDVCSSDLKPEFNINATKRFANSECAVLFSTSSNIGWFRDSRKLDFSVSGLPYYPAITSKPGSAFVSGSAIWVTSGHSKESDAASANFLRSEEHTSDLQ